MKQKPKALFAFLSLLLIVNLACASFASPTATPVPTNTPKPTNTPAPTPTLITVFVDGTAEDALEETIFEHTSGAFEFNAPKGWVIDEYDNDVYIESSESVFFYVAVTNTGYQLSADEYDNFVQNSEDFFYGYRDGFQETSREANESINLKLIEKTYPVDGETYFARSIYQQFGQSIFIVEMFGSQNEILSNPSYDQIFAAFFQSLVVDSGVAATLPVYSLSWIFQSADQAYNFQLPQGWKYDYLEINEVFQTMEGLISPDEHAVIQVFSSFDTINYGTDDHLNYLEGYTERLLNSNYSGNSNDIQILNKDSKSGKMLLEWKSNTSAINGYALIAEATNSSEPLLIIIFWDQPFDEIYNQPSLDILNNLFLN